MPFLNEMVESFQTAGKEEAPEQRVNADTLSDAPEGSLRSRFKFDVDRVESALKGRIRGQDAAIKAIVDSLKIVKAGLQRRDRPLFVVLLVGPTGVGKTEIVRALAESLWGSSDEFCRVNMNTLSQEHYAASLSGPPPGYVGSKEGYTVLDKGKIEGSFSKPGVVLFDEIEKASDQVIQTLLNVFDDGRLTMASGNKEFNFRNCLIFMTSNLGARKIINSYKKERKLMGRLLRLASGKAREERVLEVVEQDIRKRFLPEFVNRVDKVVAFNWLDGGVVSEIVDLEVEQLKSRVEQVGAELEVEAEVRDFVARVGFDEAFGARAIYRAVRTWIELPLSEELVSAPPGEGGTTRFVVCLRHGKVIVDRTVE